MSLACDTAMALPPETGLATCLVATQLARAAGLARDLLPRAHALAMLKHIGCTASSSENAAVTGIIEGSSPPATPGQCQPRR